MVIILYYAAEKEMYNPIYPREQIAYEGSIASIYCFTDGPALWKKNYRDLPQSMYRINFIQIAEVSDSDKGKYTCSNATDQASTGASSQFGVGGKYHMITSLRID